ncbi:MAG TPA: acetyl-CoA carboxylase biotin carboxyl carrier protein subunit, partial [Fimbriimonas sp.]|nr:acetyl-CoA carboxylase biotin carboxyl carrier protein subunit [Fimbriimonas sp.]
QMDELGKLITEYKLTEASLEVEGFKISLKKAAPKVVVQQTEMVQSTPAGNAEFMESAEMVISAPVQAGIPISSPMTGIYYSSSSPSSPPFVKEGDNVTAGQVIGLIEAMKVFNEIHATTSGTVLKVCIESGALVNPGDPLIYVG